ncbi:putative Mitosis protein DIM1 [Trypanosoma vivax]|uniref:Putative spliceosomal U5 snRNP-specific protein n=1 Tax=Trypanosoma vivax (strain Y486) TaxID=1055687 RepID=G0U0J7_TRYVY|nr:putative spliceosomal U5 snRNP-specific protein [Trypanosoma vivax]KAH8610838.1 putative Mitosis protein DIM1 [Trypanosoma vivax]CCC49596.1 putative spliceosomal U5 snRNP-specific protein [Trypanosoma vivax Y486]
MAELKRLHSAWDVDRHIVLEGEKLVLIRFSHHDITSEVKPDPQQAAAQLAMRQMDEVLLSLAPKVRKYCTIYAVSTVDVPEFNVMYELGHDGEPFAVMFFYRNTHIRVDVGTGNNNKINFLIGAEDLLPIIDAAYRAGKVGKSITSSEKKFTTAAVRR